MQKLSAAMIKGFSDELESIYKEASGLLPMSRAGVNLAIGGAGKAATRLAPEAEAARMLAGRVSREAKSPSMLSARLKQEAASRAPAAAAAPSRSSVPSPNWKALYGGGGAAAAKKPSALDGLKERLRAGARGLAPAGA
jgi:hypothetical protein